MKFNRHLANRFVSDYKLPIPITSKEDFFYYYLNLLEKDYGALSKWNRLIDTINSSFNGNPQEFIDYCLETREKIITTTNNTPYYQEFNNMDMNKFTIKEKVNVSSNNIYNYNNINKIFLSVDLKKANFQALKYVNPKIVFDCDTYEKFIENFTDLYYIKESKYLRQVIFGTMNPKRHITVEKYMTNQIRIVLDDIFELNSTSSDYPLVSFSNDELVYFNPIQNIPSLFNNTMTYNDALEDLQNKIRARLGFEVNIELFMLDGYEIYSEDTLKIHKVVFNKYNLVTEENKLMCVPLPFFPIVYKLATLQEIDEHDLYFEYEKLIVKLQEKLNLHIVSSGDFDTFYIPSLKKRLACNNKNNDNYFVTFNYKEEDIDNNIDYFKKCYLSNTSTNIALESFYFYLKDKENAN